MNRVLIVASQVLLALFALGILVVQGVVLPMAAQQSLETFPEVDFLYLPLLYSLEFVLLLADVVILCLWMLLARVWAGTIFSDSSFRLVNVIVGCFAGGIGLVWAALRATRPVVSGVLRAPERV